MPSFAKIVMTFLMKTQFIFLFQMWFFIFFIACISIHGCIKNLENVILKSESDLLNLK